MNMRWLALVLAMSGCAAPFQWRTEPRPAAWTETDWTRELGVPLVVKNEADVVYVGAEGGVYAVRGGQKLWAVPLPPAARLISVGDGKVVVVSYALGDKRHGFADQTASDINRRTDGHLSAFNAVDGAKLWDVPFDAEGSRLSPATLSGGKVLVVSGMRLMALDASSGQTVWSQPLLKEKGAFSKMNAGHPWARVAPAVADGKVCAIAWNNAAVFDLGSGQKLAEERLSDYGTASILSAQNACYFATARNAEGGFGKTQVVRVDVDRSTKKLRKAWNEKDWGDKRDLGISNLLIGPSGLYAISNFRVKAIDPATGKQLWVVKEEPAAPVAAMRGTRTKLLARGLFGETYNFTLDTSAGAVWNDRPGTGFAATQAALFFASAYKDQNAGKKAPRRDVVTALDAKTGAYLGSYDLGGAIVLDLTATPDGALVVATDQGLRTVKASSFVAQVH